MCFMGVTGTGDRSRSTRHGGVTALEQQYWRLRRAVTGVSSKLKRWQLKAGLTRNAVRVAIQAEI